MPNSRHLSWAGLDRQKERRLSETSSFLPSWQPALPSRPTALPAIGPLCEALYTLWLPVWSEALLGQQSCCTSRMFIKQFFGTLVQGSSDNFQLHFYFLKNHFVAQIFLFGTNMHTDDFASLLGSGSKACQRHLKSLSVASKNGESH